MSLSLGPGNGFLEELSGIEFSRRRRFVEFGFRATNQNNRGGWFNWLRPTVGLSAKRVRFDIGPPETIGNDHVNEGERQLVVHELWCFWKIGFCDRYADSSVVVDAVAGLWCLRNDDAGFKRGVIAAGQNSRD